MIPGATGAIFLKFFLRFWISSRIKVLASCPRTAEEISPSYRTKISSPTACFKPNLRSSKERSCVFSFSSCKMRAQGTAVISEIVWASCKNGMTLLTLGIFSTPSSMSMAHTCWINNFVSCPPAANICAPVTFLPWSKYSPRSSFKNWSACGVFSKIRTSQLLTTMFRILGLNPCRAMPNNSTNDNILSLSRDGLAMRRAISWRFLGDRDTSTLPWINGKSSAHSSRRNSAGKYKLSSRRFWRWAGSNSSLLA